MGSAVAGEPVGEIVSALGEVEILREGSWHPLKPGDQVAAGAVVRTGAGSRAAVQLANGTQLKLNAHSQLELKSVTARAQGYVRTSADAVKNVLRVLSGEVWIRNSSEPLEIQTLPATATIRGTEFNLAVEPDVMTSLTVLEGLVELSNPQGSVLVATNERGVAKLGKAPRKTVLVNPRDAVQWTLYYPGQVSYRDYPLTSLAPSQLKDRADTLNSQLASSPRDLNALVELGEVSFDLGKRKEARAAFERALRLAPTSGAAHTGLGWVYLDGGEPKAALGELRLAKPATAGTLAGKALALYQLGRLDEAQQVTAEAKRRFPSSPLPYTQAALDALVRGQPKLAKQALKQALGRDPNDAVARSLQSNIYLVQNRKQSALDTARQAIQSNPSSPTAYLALSAAEQAEFDLEAALKDARKAVELDPENPQTRIQEARLLFGMGRTREAYAVAKKARELPPKDSMVESTWGFILLARNQIDEAAAAFKEAITLDTTNGEPHLGLGLALFRRNRTEEAVAEMRKASLLDSEVSLYQSYLGKAYYEIKNDPLAGKSFARAKNLDPRDPTPYFYDAIRLQSINRPVEALENLQESIALNDNRAVYRSRLLLDEDLAARSASLARIYDNLGFDRLAQLEASKSLSFDRANFSAHRFLADSYTSRPRYEAARVSELLQAQLMQPLNAAPDPQQFAETNLFIPRNAGPASSTLNEYSSLFLRNGVHANISGTAGNHETIGDEVSAVGVTDRFSYGLGQFHYESNGFRENNDITHDIYRAFGQVAVTPDFDLQVELRSRRTSHGDLRLRFEAPDEFTHAIRQNIEERTLRANARGSLKSNADVLFSLAYVDRTETNKGLHPSLLPQTERLASEGYDLQGQYILRTENANVVAGMGAYEIDNDLRTEVKADGDCPFTTTGCVHEPEANQRQADAYVYADVSLAKTLLGTLGLSYWALKDGLVEFNSVNPKLGLQWDVTEGVRFRTAATRTVKRSLIVEQTLEPTTVAGFNQVFDDFNGTRAEFLGFGIDAKFTNDIQAGIELSRRDLLTPRQFVPEDVVRFEDQREDLIRFYLDLVPAPNWAIGTGYQHEVFERDPASITVELPNRTIIRTAEEELPTRVETQTIPLFLHFTRPFGLFVGIDAAYVYQRVDLSPFAPAGTQESEDFFIVNTSLGYRFPKRKGFVSLDVQNLFDEEFLYQDENIQTAEPSEPRYIPDRSVYVRLSLNF